MISVPEKDCRIQKFPAPLDHSTTEEKFNKILSTLPDHRISSVYNCEEVKEKLTEIYGHKCAYCETIWAGGMTVRIDHYRPKKYIKEESKMDHYGYYWLALEWTNLLPCCDACNQKKSNHFPLLDLSSRVNAIDQEIEIIGSTYRDYRSAPLINEKRLLLHPELDEVEKYLVFSSDGSVKAKNGSEMGQKSIDVYDLNRGYLIWQRKQKIDNFYGKLLRIFHTYEDHGANEYALIFLKHELNRYFTEMLEEQDETKAYSRIGFYMFHNFKEFYIDQLQEFEEYQEILTNFYKRLIASI